MEAEEGDIDESLYEEPEDEAQAQAQAQALEAARQHLASTRLRNPSPNSRAAVPIGPSNPASTTHIRPTGISRLFSPTASSAARQEAIAAETAAARSRKQRRPMRLGNYAPSLTQAPVGKTGTTRKSGKSTRKNRKTRRFSRR